MGQELGSTFNLELDDLCNFESHINSLYSKFLYIGLFVFPLYQSYYHYLILSYEINIKEKVGQMIIYMWNIMKYFTEDFIAVKNVCVCVLR